MEDLVVGQVFVTDFVVFCGIGQIGLKTCPKPFIEYLICPCKQNFVACATLQIIYFSNLLSVVGNSTCRDVFKTSEYGPPT